jgi:hypothetical protein
VTVFFLPSPQLRPRFSQPEPLLVASRAVIPESEWRGGESDMSDMSDIEHRRAGGLKDRFLRLRASGNGCCCWNPCGSRAERGSSCKVHVPGCDSLVALFRTWFRAVLPWPRAGPSPGRGLEGCIWSCPCPRRQGGSRQGAGVTRSGHSARPVARPFRAKLPRGGGSLCPHRGPSRPHRPSCAQAWHTAGS